MILEQIKNPSGLWALIGSEQDFKALRNLVMASKESDRCFSSSEATVRFEVGRAIYNRILEGEK